MSIGNFFRNAAWTAQSTTFPVFVISAVVLSTSYFLYQLYDVASMGDHYAFLYHILASPFVVVPFALSIKEKTRFEDHGYIYRWNSQAVSIYTCYCLLTSISWAYGWAYWSTQGALGAALVVLTGWLILMEVNLVPLWFLAIPQEPKQQRKEASN